MKLFRKTKITIIVDETTRTEVMEFAEKHSIKKRKIRMLADTWDFAAIEFYTIEKRDEVIEELKKEFGEKFKVREEILLIFVKRRGS